VTSAERAIVAVLLGTAIMAVIYLSRRARTGDLEWRRDVLWVVGLVGVGIAIAAVFTAPASLVSLVVPGIIALGGGYLVWSSEEGTNKTVGRLAIAVGIATAILGLIRMLALP
jgi:hypothetical protein